MLSQLSERMAVSGCWRLSVKPMVKATMPTVKAETRKTCDTEPAAGGIARTMTLARRAGIAPRGDRAVRENGTSTHTKRPPRQAADEKRTRWRFRDQGKELKSRAPAAFAGGALIGSFVAGPWRRRASGTVSISAPLHASSH